MTRDGNGSSSKNQNVQTDSDALQKRIAHSRRAILRRKVARLGNGAGVVFVFVALISAFVIIAMSEHDCGCRQQSEKTYCHREFGIEIHGLVSS